ncbi:EpsD family peptidyl-prolyl cis-trans isomerase [Duganella fentianensis]|uniref:EpsD family peptidyl-prolyl cis-trans isomerase n=1 Tax=Duganella fentianensis TaxID=2692177 RepID=UPI0032B2DFB1
MQIYIDRVNICNVVQFIAFYKYCCSLLQLPFIHEGIILNQIKQYGLESRTLNRVPRHTMCAVAVLVAFSLAACGGKDKKPGQSLASVDGEEITVLQLNEELQRANVQAAQQAAASKQILESLIDRQLLLNAAVKEKLDRDPKVVQEVERAKALVVAQAYMQKHLTAPTKPTREEVEKYYHDNPVFFSQRKLFDLRQLLLATRDLDDAMRAEIDKARSLDDVGVQLDARQIKYARGQAARSTADLPPELSAKLQVMAKGQLFIVREGERSLVMTIAEVKDNPISLEVAAPQIEQFLLNLRNKEAASAEIKRLRAAAKIEMLQKDTTQAAAAPAASAASAASTAENGAGARAVEGLK